MFPTLFEVKVYWRMRGESREGSFGRVEDGGELGTGFPQCFLFVGW
jgi:hypothetical protein